MKKYIIAAGIAFFLSSCADKLEITPPNSITDEQIKELLASGDQAKIDLVMGSMANGMPLLFNYAGILGAGVADTYYTSQGLDVNRSLEGNDIVFGDNPNITVFGYQEYQLLDFSSASVNKNYFYWYYAWNVINTANKMLNFLSDDIVGSNKSLQEFKARGLVMRAYGYNYLMENYQDAYLQGGQNKLGIMLYDYFSPTQPDKPRSTAAETYAFIKNDLSRAIQLLQESGKGFTSERSDIDLAVAHFLNARVALWTGDWNTVVASADAILANYPTLMNQAQYGGKNTGTQENPVFRPETNGFLNINANPEVILGFPVGQALTHFHAYTNAFGEGLGGVSRGYKRIDNRLFEKIDENDYRKDCFLKEDFGNYRYPKNGVLAFIPAYTNLKFAATHSIGIDDPAQVGTVTAYYMRTSEVLLMKAEALAQAGRDAEAKAVLNTLLAARTREGQTPLTVDTYASMQGLSTLEMVQLQTRIEMWGEGGREYYNNKRWGIPVDRTSSANHTVKVTYPVSGMTLMIPEEEVLYNPLVQQN